MKRPYLTILYQAFAPGKRKVARCRQTVGANGPEAALPYGDGAPAVAGTDTASKLYLS